MTAIVDRTEARVRKSITVDASAEDAFRVFTDDLDSWWLRSHHLGGSVPMRKAVIEPRQNGRCYTDQVDGTQCQWGTVLIWEPPHRLVLAWQVTSDWKEERDLARSSEVEVRFTSQPDGSTRVDLEHRHFERHGAGADAMRTAVDSPNGWSALLAAYSEQAGSPQEPK